MSCDAALELASGRSTGAALHIVVFTAHDILAAAVFRGKTRLQESSGQPKAVLPIEKRRARLAAVQSYTERNFALRSDLENRIEA
jgi:hypothetical protein